MATFGLVHGGAHGAWCWERVVAALEAAGQSAVAVDLPCDDEDAGAAEYAALVTESLRTSGDDVVLVGHSLGGLTLPLVAQSRPVRHLIFVAALLPVPGQSLRDQQALEPEMMFPYAGGPAGLRDRFYNTCAREDADRAMALMRPQALKPFVETTPLRSWPEVPSSYVLCTEDRACNPDWGRRAARDRLGVDAVELEGTGHSPFMDRPAELVQLFLRLTGERAAA